MTEPKISSIGKYRIIELVGEGAMGVVYRAQDSVLQRTVAIKVMNESIARQEDLRKRFLHEAQAAGSLQHPNVVTIYDLGEVDGHLFIAMEFVQGVDLEHLIELEEPLSLQARLDIIIDVLTGLAYELDDAVFPNRRDFGFGHGQDVLPLCSSGRQGIFST